MSGMLNLARFNVAAVPDPEVVDPGEYKVRIASTIMKTDEGGEWHNCEEGEEPRNITLVLELVDKPAAPPIFYTLWIPTGDETETQLTKTLQALKAFGKAFDIDLDRDGIDVEIWKGKESWAKVIRSTHEAYGERNELPRNLPWVTTG